MAEGYLLADVDLDLDDCDDILDMSTSSMMSIGAGDDLFDDDAILPASSAVNAVPPTIPDKLVTTLMISCWKCIGCTRCVNPLRQLFQSIQSPMQKDASTACRTTASALRQLFQSIQSPMQKEESTA